MLKFGINEATGEKLPYPCITMGNVYVFPGSPMFFKLSFRALCKVHLVIVLLLKIRFERIILS